MNSKPDPRVKFEPDSTDLPLQTRHLDSWLPALALVTPGMTPARWMTRSSRGLSWNRAGLISSKDARR